MNATPLSTLTTSLAATSRDDVARVQAAVEAAVPNAAHNATHDAIHDAIHDAARDTPGSEVRSIVLTGCGDSFHAGEVVAHWLGAEASALGIDLRAVPVIDCAANLPDGIDLSATLLVAISSGGATARTVEAAEAYVSRGARAIAITGSPNTALGAVCGAEIVVLAEPYHRDAPGLHSYFCSLVAVADVVHRTIGSTAPWNPAADDVINAIAAVAESPVDVEHFADITRIELICEESDLGSAWFIVAKLAEVAAIPATVSEVGDWFHIGAASLPPETVGTLILTSRAADAPRRDLLKAVTMCASVGRPTIEVHTTEQRRALAAIRPQQFLADFLVGAQIAQALADQRGVEAFRGAKRADHPALPFLSWTNPHAGRR